MFPLWYLVILFLVQRIVLKPVNVVESAVDNAKTFIHDSRFAVALNETPYKNGENATFPT